MHSYLHAESHFMGLNQFPIDPCAVCISPHECLCESVHGFFSDSRKFQKYSKY